MTPSPILVAVEAVTGVTVAEMLARNRNKTAEGARFMAYWIARHVLGMSLSRMALEFGRNRQTCFSGCRRADALIRHDPQFVLALNEAIGRMDTECALAGRVAA